GPARARRQGATADAGGPTATATQKRLRARTKVGSAAEGADRIAAARAAAERRGSVDSGCADAEGGRGGRRAATTDVPGAGGDEAGADRNAGARAGGARAHSADAGACAGGPHAGDANAAGVASACGCATERAGAETGANAGRHAAHEGAAAFYVSSRQVAGASAARGEFGAQTAGVPHCRAGAPAERAIRVDPAPTAVGERTSTASILVGSSTARTQIVASPVAAASPARSNLSLTVAGPAQAATGQSVEFEIRIVNNSGRPLTDLGLR